MAPARCLFPLRAAILAVCLLPAVSQPARALDLSDAARSRLHLDKDAPPPKVTPMRWDQPEDYSAPAELLAEVPKAMLDLLGFTPARLTPLPPVTPRIQAVATGLVPTGSAPGGLSFARRGSPDGICRVYVARETAVALDDTTFVQWHERAHCDRGYSDRELEESKANVQGYLMMAKTGDLWYAMQSIDGRAGRIGGTEAFFAPYLLGYRVAIARILPLLKRRGGPKQERGFEIHAVLQGMSERQVNALSMLLVEDAKRKQLEEAGKSAWTPWVAPPGAIPENPRPAPR